MHIRYLVIAGLLASAAGAQAEVIGSVPPGPIGATPGVVHTPMPAALTLDGAPATPAIPAAPAVPGVSPAVPATPAVPAIPATPVAPVVTLPSAPVATEVPEPSSMALLLAGAVGVGALRRRRARKA